MLTVGREAAIEVQVCLYKYFQAIINITCEGTRVWCWATHCYSLILFQDLLVSTTLSPGLPLPLSLFLINSINCMLLLLVKITVIMLKGPYSTTGGLKGRMVFWSLIFGERRLVV
ncbi:hypothetical protein NC653_019842 [Populus alba x Populus x berolinensis]|uniref:Uncharacterized protein n=1 Tax=Populus alba x Populus x berolinensis TaxID=444605 RepID=A0AAD6MJN9_9ROSI|nr:hypothetical protein NC653_019842 [Populus alba x Populus x berolinensis]